MLKNSKWIWCNASPQADEYGEFYSSFEYSGGRLRLAVSADSNYAAYINGRLAAFGQYADFPYDKIYDEIDLSEFATIGKNHLAIVVWYYGTALLRFTLRETQACFSRFLRTVRPFTEATKTPFRE